MPWTHETHDEALEVGKIQIFKDISRILTYKNNLSSFQIPKFTKIVQVQVQLAS